MPELQDYKVNLENYYGPLDLLLHLVKETEVDITAIRLANACEQYIRFLQAMERLDIDLSGDFLSLASQLLLIKSRTLAPPEAAPEGEETDEEEGDASLELIKKLLEYKRFKDRGRALARLADEQALRYTRPRIRLEGETEQEPLRNLELWDLVLLFSRAIKGIRLDAAMSILYHDVPLEVFVDSVLKALESKKAVQFSELVGDRADRGRVVGTFLALLQLAKEQRVRVAQEIDHGDIRVDLVESVDPVPPAGAEAPDAA
jgi:segregation and condensation protein A